MFDTRRIHYKEITRDYSKQVMNKGVSLVKYSVHELFTNLENSDTAPMTGAGKSEQQVNTTDWIVAPVQTHRHTDTHTRVQIATKTD